MNFVFSVLDQMAKQTLHYSGGISLGNFDGKLLVASSSAIYSILPIPAETQIQVRLKVIFQNVGSKYSSVCSKSGV